MELALSFLTWAWIVALLTLCNGLTQSHFHYEPLGAGSQRLILSSLDAPPVWMTSAQAMSYKSNGIDFVDITDNQNLGSSITRKLPLVYPTLHKNNTKRVTGILARLNEDGPRANLAQFTSFYNRYYDSDHGNASSRWLYAKVQNYTSEFAHEHVKDKINVRLELHGWKQASVIIRIEPEGADVKSPLVILGAHCDSLNTRDPFGRSPGADDDGSGVVALLEVYRVLLLSGYMPSIPLEFHFYSAEEVGLLGSQAIAQFYDETAHTIRGMLQLDTIAWRKNGIEPYIGLFQGGVDADLTKFVWDLANTYVNIPVKPLDPSIFTSDQFAWTRFRYPSAAVMEAALEDANTSNVHTSHDTVEESPEFSFEHLLEFAKLAVAFSVELTI